VTLRVIVADDAALSRDRLVRLLRTDPEVEVVAECIDGNTALAAIREHAPDAAFLDVRMPGLDGIGVIGALAGQALPVFVLVTAHTAYAAEAFELDATDYLLKPVSPIRLRTALARVRERLTTRPAGKLDQVLALLKDLGRKPAPPTIDRLPVHSEDRTFFLRAESIDWIEAAGNYLQVHVGTLTHTVRGTMTRLETSLDPARFVRISRSAIVNIDRIQEIQPWFQGAHVVILRDRTRLTTSRRYRRSLSQLLGK
jgi:two-component system LytT family response regulator